MIFRNITVNNITNISAYNVTDNTDFYTHYMTIVTIILSSICVIVCCLPLILAFIFIIYKYLLNYVKNFNKRLILVNPITSIVITNFIDIASVSNRVEIEEINV